MRRFPKELYNDFPKAFAELKQLSTPAKIQDFLDKIEINFEQKGDTCCSPLVVLQERRAHCLEGAMLAAAALWLHGQAPLLLDLKTTDADMDHVVALFKRGNYWGAISKTNHAVLRYRDPIYKTPREVAVSYFHEYFLSSGIKTLRSYSAKPFDLSKQDDAWLTSREHLWDLSAALDWAAHTAIVPKSLAKRDLRLASMIERRAGEIVEWRAPKKI